MKTKIQKWGNSLAARIPKSFAAELGIGDGSPVEMTLEAGAVVIKPDREKAWDLDDLLADVTNENVHPAWEAEAAAGAGDLPGADEEDGR